MQSIFNLLKNKEVKPSSNPNLKKQNLEFCFSKASLEYNPYAKKYEHKTYLDIVSRTGQRDGYISKEAEFVDQIKACLPGFNVNSSCHMGGHVYATLSCGRKNAGALNEEDIEELMNVLELYDLIYSPETQGLYKSLRQINGYTAQKNYEILNLNFEKDRSCLILNGIRQVVGARIMLMLPGGIDVKDAQEGRGIAGIDLNRENEEKNIKEGMEIHFVDSKYAARFRDKIKYRFSQDQRFYKDEKLEKTYYLKNHISPVTVTYESHLLLKHRSAIKFLHEYCQISAREIEEIYKRENLMDLEEVKTALDLLPREQSLQRSSSQTDFSANENNNNLTGSGSSFFPNVTKEMSEPCVTPVKEMENNENPNLDQAP